MLPRIGRNWRVFGNRRNTVSESTASNTELSEFFWPSPSARERAQCQLFVCQRKLSELFTELTKFAQNWIPRFCRADLGWSFFLTWRILGKLPRISKFSALFFFFSGTPNSRPNLSAFLSNFTFSIPNLFTPIFCLQGGPTELSEILSLLEQYRREVEGQRTVGNGPKSSERLQRFSDVLRDF